MSEQDKDTEATASDQLRELIERTARAEERARILEQQMQNQPSGKPQERSEPATPMSESQLQAAVDAGRISEDEAQRILERQREQADEKRIRETIRAEERDRKIRSQLEAYRKAKPELDQVGSDDWKAANEEYKRLTEDYGFQSGLATQIVACRNVFGPPEVLQAEHEERRATHQETGGAAPSARKKAAGKDDAKIPEAIRNSPKHREFYEEQIKKGRFKGWDDPAIQRQAGYIH